MSSVLIVPVPAEEGAEMLSFTLKLAEPGPLVEQNVSGSESGTWVKGTPETYGLAIVTVWSAPGVGSPDNSTLDCIVLGAVPVIALL